MAALGRFGEFVWGADPILGAILTANITGSVMAALNTGVAFRHVAADARDVKSIWVNWSAVTAGGTVEVRYETVDAATGKPTGTLYDAAATKSLTPVAGWQQFTFATLPTAGRTAGASYCIVLLTTVAGTTQTLRAYTANTNTLPVVALTAVDGTTRANFAEVSTSIPCCLVEFEDSSEERAGFVPWATFNLFAIYGTRAAGAMFEVPSGVTMTVTGVHIEAMSRTGSPDDLRARIFNAGGQVANASITIDKDYLLNANNRRLRFPFPATVSLTGGTHWLVLDQTNHSTTAGNNYSFRTGAARSSATVPAGWISRTTADIDAGTITWTDTASEQPAIGLVVDDVTAAGGGGPSYYAY